MEDSELLHLISVRNEKNPFYFAQFFWGWCYFLSVRTENNTNPKKLCAKLNGFFFLPHSVFCRQMHKYGNYLVSDCNCLF